MIKRILTSLYFWLAVLPVGVAFSAFVSQQINNGTGTPYQYQMVAGGSGGSQASTGATCDVTNPQICAPVDANGEHAVPSASTTGGATPTHILSATSTNATSIKGSAGTLYSLFAVNTSPNVYYVKLYDTSTTPTCSTQAVVHTYPVPPSNGGFTNPIPTVGMAFLNGLGLCMTLNQADNDNTNSGTGVTIDLDFK